MPGDVVDTYLVAVDKNTIKSEKSFKDILSIYNIYIFKDEPNYYILDGDPSDLKEFSDYWNA